MLCDGFRIPYPSQGWVFIHGMREFLSYTTSSLHAYLQSSAVSEEESRRESEVFHNRSKLRYSGSEYLLWDHLSGGPLSSGRHPIPDIDSNHTPNIINY